MAKKRKMIAQLTYHYESGDVTAHIDLSRFERQFQQAQYELDTMVMTSMKPYMPHNTGTFINMTSALSASIAGSGYVVAAAPPMGRFLYEGKVMVGKTSRSAWAKKGEKKVTTEKNLEFSKGQDHWFDAAKAADGSRWVSKAKKIAGGG